MCLRERLDKYVCVTRKLHIIPCGQCTNISTSNLFNLFTFTTIFQARGANVKPSMDTRAITSNARLARRCLPRADHVISRSATPTEDDIALPTNAAVS